VQWFLEMARQTGLGGRLHDGQFRAFSLSEYTSGE
jgi:hypothetical protein